MRSSFYLFFSLLIVAITGSSLQSAGLKSKITFLNGDTLHAEVTQFSPTDITIKHPHFTQECSLRTDNILQINIENKQDIVPKENLDNSNFTTIRLKPRYKASNQMDTLRGSFKQNDEHFISLDTKYAGLLNIQRSKILSIDIQPNVHLLYSGPKSIKEWKNTLHAESWLFKNAALYSGLTNGNISQAIDLPEQIIVDFDLAWKKSAYLTFRIFSDDHTLSNPDNYYEFQINNTSISFKKLEDSSFKRIKRNPILEENTQVIQRSLQSEKSAKVQLYIDRKKGLCHVFINNLYYSSFQDLDPTPEKLGNGVHLISRSSAFVKLSRLRISDWSGELPSKDQIDAFKELKGEGQRILLKNGDAIIGKTGVINNGLMNIETEFGPLKLSVSGMRSIDLSETPEDSPKMEADDLKLHFNSGGWVILKPISIKQNKLTGFHQAFGTKEFDLSTFKQIDFHIYNEEFNNMRKSEDW